jgi:subtilisin family serine protease
MKKIILTFIVIIYSVINAPLCGQTPTQLASPNELLIRFADNALPADIDWLKRRYGAQELGITPLTKVRLWKVNLAVTSALGLPTIIEVSGDATNGRKPPVTAAQANRGTIGKDSVKNSENAKLLPQFDLLKQLRTDSCFTYPLTWLESMTIPTEKMIKVAIMDSGIDGIFQKNGNFTPYPNHQAIFGSMYAGGYDFVGQNPLTPTDSLGHGTHVAGIIAKLVRLSPVADRVKLLILKTQDKNGQGSLWNLCRAFDYAMQQGATISNLSLSWVVQKPLSTQPVIEYVFNFANNYNQMLILGAAGNHSVDVDNNSTLDIFPAKLLNNNLLCVTSTNCVGALSSFANWGRKSVDVAALGENIYSTYLAGSFKMMSGTSMATPMVAATAALLRLKQPTWSTSLVKDKILTTVDISSGLKGKIVSDGILNMLKSLDIRYRAKMAAEKPLLSMITTAPNPFKDNLLLTINSDDEALATIHIYNTTGQRVFEKQLDCVVGDNSIDWRAEGMASGIYFIQIKVNQSVLTQKVVKY